MVSYCKEIVGGLSEDGRERLGIIRGSLEVVN